MDRTFLGHPTSRPSDRPLVGQRVQAPTSPRRQLLLEVQRPVPTLQWQQPQTQLQERLRASKSPSAKRIQWTLAATATRPELLAAYRRYDQLVHGNSQCSLFFTAMAEGEGFEPPIRLPVCRISSAVLSTTQPPLRGSMRGAERRALSNGAMWLKQGRRYLRI